MQYINILKMNIMIFKTFIFNQQSYDSVIQKVSCYKENNII